MNFTRMVDSTIDYLNTKKSLQTKCIKAECLKFIHYMEENGYKETKENYDSYLKFYNFCKNNKLIPS